MSVSTGSFSSCSSGSFSSSGSTGSFSSGSSSSSGDSLSSCSTVVAPQPVICPFGIPQYNYFWIENKSKTNPRLSYYYNYKTNSVVWQRPLPKDVPIPYYAITRNPGQTNLLAEDDRDIILSDSEDDAAKRKRLALKRRNRRLIVEDKDDSIQILSVKKAIKSKKMLDILWKLHRLPGESIKEIKNRLLDPSLDKVKVKDEVIDNEYNTQNSTDIPIKTEPSFNNDNCINGIENVNQTIKTNEDSDSDPENVSYLIKQEYMMNYDYTDSELENENKIQEEIPEEIYKCSEEEDESYEESDEEQYYINPHYNSMQHNVKFEDNTNMTNTNMCPKEPHENEIDNFEYTYEAPSLADLFDVEINEDPEGEVFIPPSEQMDDNDFVVEDINWTFQQSAEVPNDSLLTRNVMNVLYPPKPKKIKQKKKKPTKKKKQKPIPKLIIKIKPEPHVKQEIEADEEAPIICDMYGTRTINYNCDRPIKMKVPKWQCCSKLSGSSDSEKEFEIYKQKKKQPRIKKEKSSNSEKEFEIYKQKKKQPCIEKENNEIHTTGVSKIKTEKDSCLELRNWFPKRQNRKRVRRSRKKSDSSWYESNVSDYSDINDVDIAVMRMKREKRSTSPESNKESDSEINDIFPVPIKLEKDGELLPNVKIEQPEIIESMISETKPEVDPRQIKELKIAESIILETQPEVDPKQIEEPKIAESIILETKPEVDPRQTEESKITESIILETQQEVDPRQIEEPKITGSMILETKTVDLSIVKVERRSSEEYLEENFNNDNDVVFIEKKDASIVQIIEDLASSSSSCSCSNSSCSCSSSSSSSSDEEDNTEKKETKEEIL